MLIIIYLVGFFIMAMALDDWYDNFMSHLADCLFWPFSILISLFHKIMYW